MHDEYDYDNSYTYPIAAEGEEIQWQRMADEGFITQDTTRRLIAADKRFAKLVLARKRPSLMTPGNRMKFMRTLSMHGWTEADLKSVDVPRSNRGFAQRLIDYSHPVVG